MTVKHLVTEWFVKGDFLQLPIADHFQHNSPCGTIEGRQTYLNLVAQNEDKFLGQTFEVHDSFFPETHACVGYGARQGEAFSLDVNEWYYFQNGLISEIIAYYHMREIRSKRMLSNSNQ